MVLGPAGKERMESMGLVLNCIVIKVGNYELDLEGALQHTK